MKVIGIIPARSGSKRLPGKNLRPFHGRPLIWWTVEAAKTAGIAPLVLTTDSEEIADACPGLPVVFRPPELCQDLTPTLPVIQHALQQAENTADLAIYHWILILQPTSPLRLSSDIEKALDMAEPGVSSVVSVTPTEPLGPVGGATFKTNGAIYLLHRHTLIRGDLYGPTPRLLVMPPGRSIDIDTLEDFKAAERALLQKETVEWGV